MSAGPGERAERWTEWRKRAGWIEGDTNLPLVGFMHQCGSATLVSDYSRGSSCAGCRVEITDPENECAPLFSVDDLPWERP